MAGSTQCVVFRFGSLSRRTRGFACFFCKGQGVELFMGHMVSIETLQPGRCGVKATVAVCTWAGMAVFQSSFVPKNKHLAPDLVVCMTSAWLNIPFIWLRYRNYDR